jgi:hypothetical protein
MKAGTPYRLIRGIISSTRLTTEGTGFQVRVLPDMLDIAESENLPIYTCFFKSAPIAYSPGDVVWAIVTEDFNIGYILDYAESVNGTPLDTILALVNDAETTANFPQTKVEELSVLRASQFTIEFENIYTRHCGIIYSNKTVMLYTSDGDIYLSNPTFSQVISKDGNVSIKGRSSYTGMSGDITTESTGIITEKSGSKTLEVDSVYKENVGGNKQSAITGDVTSIVIGKENNYNAGIKSEVLAQGESKTILIGSSDTTIGAGNYTVTVAGGNISVGSPLIGTITIVPGLGVTINSTIAINLVAPSIKLVSAGITSPTLPVIPNILGGGMMCSIPFCPFSGFPHQGNVLGVG